MPNLVHRTGVSGGALVDPADTARLDAQAARFRVASKAAGTRRAYRVDLVDFEAWCNDYGYHALPAEPATVARYIADLSARGRAVSTINGRVSAIAWAHKHAGAPDPTINPAVRDVMAGTFDDSTTASVTGLPAGSNTIPTTYAPRYIKTLGLTP